MEEEGEEMREGFKVNVAERAIEIEIGSRKGVRNWKF